MESKHITELEQFLTKNKFIEDENTNKALMFSLKLLKYPELFKEFMEIVLNQNNEEMKRLSKFKKLLDKSNEQYAELFSHTRELLALAKINFKSNI